MEYLLIGAIILLSLAVHNMPVAYAAIIAGILAAIAGSSGVTLLKDAPEIAASLIIGTMIGVVVFKGIPVGPLIAWRRNLFLDPRALVFQQIEVTKNSPYVIKRM